jgi:hypothetical protein
LVYSDLFFFFSLNITTQAFLDENFKLLTSCYLQQKFFRKCQKCQMLVLEPESPESYGTVLILRRTPSRAMLEDRLVAMAETAGSQTLGAEKHHQKLVPRKAHFLLPDAFPSCAPPELVYSLYPPAPLL